MLETAEKLATLKETYKKKLTLADTQYKKSEHKRNVMLFDHEKLKQKLKLEKDLIT